MAVTGTGTASSAASYSYLQYKNKISGLVSGMDIDSVMEKLMKAESAQMEKLQQQKVKYEWKRDAYREVNTSLNTFRTDLFDKFGLSNSWVSKNIDTSSSKVNITAGSTANGNLTISSATVAKNSTGSFTSATNAITNARVTNKTQLSEIENFDGIGIGALKLTVSGQELEINGLNATSSLEELVTKLNEKQITVDGVTKNAFNASIKDGKVNIASSLGDIIVKDSATQTTLKSLSMLNEVATNSTDLGNSLKIMDANTNKLVTLTSDAKISDLGLTGFGTLTFKVNGKEKTVDYNEGETVQQLLTKINTEDPTGNAPILKATLNKSGQLSITSSEGKVTMDESFEKEKLGFSSKIQSSDRLFEGNSDAILNGSIQGTTLLKELGFSGENTVSLNAIQADGKLKTTSIKISSTDTLNSLALKINGSGAGVTAIYNNGKLSISANNTGSGDISLKIESPAEGTIDPDPLKEAARQEQLLLDRELANNTANVFGKILGDMPTVGNEFILATGGSEASLTVNGVEYTGPSNNFSVAGYTIQLKEDIDPTDNVTVSSSTNVDGTVDKVKEFVNMYNELIKSLNSKTTEKKNISFNPLTDAQKSEMTTQEITNWEEKAKSGLLKSDSSLTNLVSKMRTILMGGVGADTLYNIGIKTSSTWSDNGKLEIDEAKLRTAIESDPDVLNRIFVGSTEKTGMINELRTVAQTSIQSIEKSAGKVTTIENQYTLGKTIISLDDKISDWKNRLKAIEERYWNQFSAMETAINKANSQSSIFSA